MLRERGSCGPGYIPPRLASRLSPMVILQARMRGCEIQAKAALWNARVAAALSKNSLKDGNPAFSYRKDMNPIY
jgi:hypothetical protein